MGKRADVEESGVPLPDSRMHRADEYVWKQMSESNMCQSIKMFQGASVSFARGGVRKV